MKYLLMVMVLLMLVMSVPMLGQDGTTPAETETPVVVEVEAEAVPDESVFGAQLVSEPTPADEAARTLLDTIYAIVYIPMAAPLIVILVNLMKTIPFLDRFSSQMLTFVWNAVIWIAFTLLNQAGYGGYFDSILNTATTIATLLLGIFGSQLASGQLYNVALDSSMPVMGYNRPKVAVG